MSIDRPNSKEIEELLTEISRGDDAMPELNALIDPELKKLAHFQLAGERADNTLNTTAIV